MSAKTKIISITMPEDVLRDLDKARGRVSRSTTITMFVDERLKALRKARGGGQET
jgi:metal-responsive CopG/Arc/MetJ family transcriptional regulator